MLNDAMTCVSVKNVGLESPTASLLVAFAEVQVDEVFLRVAIRRFRDGTLRIYLPTWEDGGCCLDGVEVPSDLRTEIVREALTAYEEAEARQKARQRHPGAMTANTVATILGDLENAGFDGSAEIIYRAGRIVTLCKSAIQNQRKTESNAQGE